MVLRFVKHLSVSGLRTDAASRFEKGTDVVSANAVNVLKRTALTMIKELAGAEISSELVDVYPKPKEKAQEVAIKYHF